MNKKEIATIVSALICTISEFEELGAPEGVLYAGSMDRIDLSGFQKIIETLIAAEIVIRKPGPVLFITEKGKKLAGNLELIAAGKQYH